MVYRAPGVPSLHPVDMALSLPREKHSHGLRRHAAVEAVRGSFDDARDAIARSCGSAPGRRQVEELVQRAAVDVEELLPPPQARTRGTGRAAGAHLRREGHRHAARRPARGHPPQRRPARAAGRAAAGGRPAYVTVAVIDDGVDASHPDLKGNVLQGKDFIDGDSDASPADGDSHGTAMAGDIAGHGHGAGGADGVKGLAPDAKILPLRDNGYTENGLAPSIRYAVDHGASVINISLDVDRTDGDPELQAIRYALQHNVVVVSASGNEGKSGAEAIGYPANYPGVVAVGAVKSSDEIWEKSNSGSNLMLSAPGYRIVSTSTDSGGYEMGTGTSDSAAYVSAACALLREKFPNLTAGQLVNRPPQRPVSPPRPRA